VIRRGEAHRINAGFVAVTSARSAGVQADARSTACVRVREVQTAAALVQLCVVPAVRARRLAPPEVAEPVLDEIARLVEQGTVEVVLTVINLGSTATAARGRPAAARAGGGCDTGPQALRHVVDRINHVDEKLIAAFRDTPW